MTQEDKELLLKDLCARLPYKLVCEVKYREDCKYKTSNMILSGVFTDEVYFTSGKGSIYSNDYKPYLFPMSSMTATEVLEYISLKESIVASDGITYAFETYKSIDWLNAHHLDWRGLIPKGLAIDATGLNIY